jgi:hypothetical protein
VPQQPCSATISVDSIDGGVMTFLVETGDCKDSSGRFEYT